MSATAGMLSKAVGRPVKYVEDRIDNMSNCDHHGSDRIYYCDLALTRDGEMKSIRIRTIEDYGAYMHFGVGHHGNALAQVTGPYRIGSVQYDLKAVVTNKCQQGAYRGFGSEVNNWMIERMVDLAARELKIDPAVLRRRNFIAPRSIPVLHPDRQRVRLRRLRAGARQGARTGRVRALARRAAAAARAGPLHRDRDRHLPGAQRVLGDRVLVLVR